MANVTVVSKIRFLAGIAPVILLIASPLLALAFLEFGNVPSDLRDEQLAALKYAQGLDAALYKMEWGRTNPMACKSSSTSSAASPTSSIPRSIMSTPHEQRAKLGALAQAAKPTLDAFRHADPHDEVDERQDARSAHYGDRSGKCR